MTLRQRALIRPIVVAAVAAAGLTLGATTASAHSNLIESSPADGAVLPALPEEVVLTFSGDVQPDYTEIAVQYDGATIDGAEPVTDGDTVTQSLEPLRARIAVSDVTVSFRIISADGHPVDGVVSFTVDANLAAEPTTTNPTTDPPTDPTAEPSDQPGSADEERDGSTDDTTPASSAGADDDSTSGTSTGTLVAIGAVVAAVIVAAGLEIRRRARRDRSGDGPVEGPTT